jgi:hypothetical protein
MVSITGAKRIRALLQNQPERQQKQAARVELRNRIRDQGIALTERMDHERTLHLRADVPVMARVAADMGAAPPPPPDPPRGPPPGGGSYGPKGGPPTKGPGAPPGPAPKGPPKAKAPRAQPPPSAPRSRSPPPTPGGASSNAPAGGKAPAPPKTGPLPKAPAPPKTGPLPKPPGRSMSLAPPTTARSRSPPGAPSTGNPMSTGSAAPMSTGSSIGSVARAAMFHIGTPRAASSLSSISRSRSGYTASEHARSPSTSGSVGSLIRRFEGLGYPGGRAPPMRPVRRQRDLQNRSTR